MKILGQYFTEKNDWIYDDIKELLLNNRFQKILDPFAGSNNLVKNEIFNNVLYKEGYDIDPFYIKDEVLYNNSFMRVPLQDENTCLVVTNPPFFYKSVARLRNNKEALNYLNGTVYIDIYMVAIRNTLKSVRHAVFILPETFLFLKNNPFLKNIVSVNVIENKMFRNTDTPVLSVIFDRDKKDLDFRIFKNGKFLFTKNYLDEVRREITPNKSLLKKIHFNDEKGQIFLKCVDGISKDDIIRFEAYNKDNINEIKDTDRAHTVIRVDDDLLKNINMDTFIKDLNSHLKVLRKGTKDLIIGPFKGNNNQNIRRRRLDFTLAKYIIIYSLKWNKLQEETDEI